MLSFDTHIAKTRLCIVLLLSACLAACGYQNEERQAPASVFHTLEGDQLVLRTMGRPVLVNFWSTSCAICLHEMPAIAALYEEYAPAGFEIVAVAMPYDPPNQVLELATENKWPFPVAIDFNGEVLAQFDSVQGTPSSFLFDAEGREVLRHVGAIDLPALRADLDELFEPADAAASAMSDRQVASGTAVRKGQHARTKDDVSDPG